MSSPRRQLPPPTVGLGTAPGHGRTALDLEPAIHAAIDAGCTLFDTAEVYGSEPVLGRALRARTLDRDAYELVTKVWQTNHAPTHVLEACRGSLRRLATDRIDLYLVHAPESWRYCGPLEIAPDSTRAAIEERVVPRDAADDLEGSEVALEATWEAMLDLVGRGLARSVGLANVERRHLEALSARGYDAPAAIQIEVHPLQPRAELRRYCADRGIRVLAHTPLSRAALLEHPELTRVAAELGTTPGRVVLRWHLDRGVSPIPGTSSPEHVRANLAPLAEPLPPSIVAVLDGLSHAAPG